MRMRMRQLALRLVLPVTFIAIIIGSSGIFARTASPTPSITASPTPISSPTPETKPSPTPYFSVFSPSLAGTETKLLPEKYDVCSFDWAPNGKALVFEGKIQGEDATKMRIWYWSLDPTLEPTALTNTDQLIDSSPRWSTDSAKIVMIRRSYKKTSRSNLTATLWTKEIEGGAGKQITSGPEDRDPFWSPDGAQIVFSRGQGPYKSQLAIVNANGDGSVRILGGQDGEMFTAPWWGKDGRIYFTKQTLATKNVTVSGQTYQVTEPGKGSIWMVNPEDGSMTVVIENEYDNRTPALSPDGTKLAFVSDRILSKDTENKFDRGNLYIKDLKTGAIFFVTNKVALRGGYLSFSPDGKKLAFLTFRSIHPAVWVINLP
jgi:Tol biopolymer transport system component